MSITTKWVDITPDMAERWLGRNPRNRVLNGNRVTILAGAILRGEWQETGDAIKFTEDGTLLDGQHRLAAIIEAGMPIRSLVIRGLAVEAQDVMDIGRSRTFGDVLSIRGYASAATMAAATRALWTYTNKGFIGHVPGSLVRPSNQQLLAMFHEHEEQLYEGRAYYRAVQEHLTGSYSSAYVTLAVLMTEADPEAFDKFHTGLVYGEGLTRGNPIYELRERLVREQASSDKRMKPRRKAALTIKAFNALINGEQITQLTWRPASGEPFPLVQDCPLNPSASALVKA